MTKMTFLMVMIITSLTRMISFITDTWILSAVEEFFLSDLAWIIFYCLLSISKFTNQIYVNLLIVLIIDHEKVNVVNSTIVTWMRLTLQYLNDGILLDNNMKVWKVRNWAKKKCNLNGFFLLKASWRLR